MTVASCQLSTYIRHQNWICSYQLKASFVSLLSGPLIHLCWNRNKYTHISHIWYKYTRDVCTCVCHVQVTFINSVTRSTVYILCKLHFMLLTCTTEPIWLPHCRYKLNCPHSKWENRCKRHAYMFQNTTYYIIYVIYLMGIYGDVCEYTCNM